MKGSTGSLSTPGSIFIYGHPDLSQSCCASGSPPLAPAVNVLAPDRPLPYAFLTGHPISIEFSFCPLAFVLRIAYENKLKLRWEEIWLENVSLQQHFSRCGPLAACIDITGDAWENGRFQGPPHPSDIQLCLGVWLMEFFNKLSRWFSYILKFENHWWLESVACLINQVVIPYLFIKESDQVSLQKRSHIGRADQVSICSVLGNSWANYWAY